MSGARGGAGEPAGATGAERSAAVSERCAAAVVAGPAVWVVRLVLGLTGLALLGVGCWLLWYETRDGTLPDLARWLVGAVALHDAVVAPLVLLVGWALVRPPVRGVVRGALVVAGCLTVVALPVLLRPGPPANPTVLPLDYPRNWALCVAAVGLVSVVLVGARRVVARWRTARGGGTGRPPTSGAVPGKGAPDAVSGAGAVPGRADRPLRRR